MKKSLQFRYDLFYGQVLVQFASAIKMKVLILSVLMLFTVTLTHAAIKTWAGGTGTGLNWTTGTNWGVTAPVAGDDIVFNTSGTISFSTMPANVSYNSITISQGTITLATASAMTLTLGGNSGTDFTITSGAFLTIGSNVNITLAANATATINGTLTVNSGRTYNTDRTSVVTTVNGTIVNTGTVTCSTSAKLNFTSGATYEHAVDGGTIPISTWATTSTCLVTGYASTASGNPPNYATIFAQSFGNFTWNCPSQTGHFSLGGKLTTINGNFTMISTGSGSFSFGNTGIGNITIGGNYIQTGGYLYCSGYGGSASNNGAARNINITGNFSLTTGGTFDISYSNITGNAVTVNIGGNFTHTTGTVKETGSTTGSNISFTGAISPQIYTSGGTVSNTVNFVVNNGATLQMGTATSPSTITGGGSFTLQSGATLGVTSSVGISAAGTNTGNIQVTGTRSYSSGNINYMGNSAQATGNGLTVAANVLINNTSAVVTFTVQASVSGNISMVSGATANLGTGFVHTASSLTLAGTVEPVNNTYGGSSSSASQKRPTFFPNTTTGIISLGNCIAGTWIGVTSTNWHTASNWCSNSVPISSTNITIAVGTYQPLISAAAVCNNITINPGATVTIAGANTLTVSGSFNNNGSFTTNGGTVTITGDYTNGGSYYGNTGNLVLNSSTTSAFTNNGTFTAGTGTVNFNGGAQTASTPKQTLFYNVIIGGTGLKTINTTNFIVIGTLSMEATGTISALPTYGTQATLQYNKPGSFTSSVEWPSTFTSTGGVIVRNTGVITLNANKTFSSCPLTVYDRATLSLSSFTISNPNNLNLYCGGASAGATISGTGLLTLGGDVYVIDANNGAAGSTISCPVALTASTTRTFSVEDDGTTAVDLAISNIISTAGTIIKSGVGTLTLSGANSFTGGTTLNAGILNINNSSALGTSAGTFTINGGSIDATVAGITTVSYPINMNTDLTFIGSQNLNLGAGNVTLNSDRTITTSASNLTLGGTISAGTLNLTKAGNGTLSFGSQAVTLKDLTISAGTLVSTSGNLSIAGNFSNNSTFTHNSGTVTYNGNGAQTINSGGNPFYNLTITNTGGTCTATTNGITSAETYTANSGTILDMVTYTLSVNNVSHSGTLLTQNTSTAPITTGKTWGGLVNYNGSAAQTAMAGTYNNLTITSIGGAKASGHITVNGVLDLAASNASSTVGALEMVTDYNGYPGTSATTNPIISYILTMGENATTVGQYDVTGIIYRSSVSANTAYTFGNQYTTYAFTVAPGTVTVTVTIGTAYGVTSAWGDPLSVKRSYEMVPTGGSGAVTMNLHYRESELNGNTETDLVTGDYDIGGGAPLGDEHGRSSFDYTNNYIGLSGVPISYFIYVDPGHKWRTVFTLHNYYTHPTVWDGSASSSWSEDANWSNGLPGVLMTVIIPDASATPNDPVLVAGITIGGMRILSGGVLNLNGQTITLEGYNYNGWEDQSGASNYAGSTVILAKSTATGGPWPIPLSGIPHFNNLTISSGAEVTVNLNSHIYISGSFTKTGNFDAGTFENTVEYNGATQTVVLPDGNNDYYSLTLSGSGTKTLPASLSIQANLELGGTASIAPTNALTIGGDLTLGSGTAFTAGSLTHNVGGDFINNGSTFTNTGSTINLNGTTAQTIGGTSSTSFNNLTVSNTTALVSANNNFSVSGTLTTNSGSIVDMGTNVLGGTPSSVSSNGTIKTANTSSSAPIPSGQSWGGTIEYSATTGSQTVVAATYNNLILDNTSGTNTTGGVITVNGAFTSGNGGTLSTANNINFNGTTTCGETMSATAGTVTYGNSGGGENVLTGTYYSLTQTNTAGTNTVCGDITVESSLSTTSGGTLDMTIYSLGGALTSVTNSGTIKTANTSSSPIPSGQAWGGTINYCSTTGGQSIVAGTYGILTLGNTSGTQTAGGNLTVTSLYNNTNPADILDMGTNSLTVTTAYNTGTIRTQNVSGTPLSSGKTWGGTVVYDATVAAQTLSGGTFNDLVFNNSYGGTLGNDVTVDGNFTLTQGALSAGGKKFIYGSNSTLIYDGSSLQSAGIEFASPDGPKTLIVSNNIGLNYSLDSRTLAGDFTLSSGTLFNIAEGSALFVNGTANNSTAANLVIKSSSSGTGCFCTAYQATSVQATVQRYVKGKSTNPTTAPFPYHFISSSISDATLSTIHQPGEYNVYRYDEVWVDGDLDQGWTRFITGLMDVGRGYAVVSNYGERPTFDFGGTLNIPNSSSTISTSVTWTETKNADHPWKIYNGTPLDPQGWNLVGNPYSCSLNAQSFISDNNGTPSKFDVGYATVYFWDDAGGNIDRSADYSNYNYTGSSYVANSGTGGSQGAPNGNIPVGQAFFIKVASTATSIDFKGTQRVANSSAQFFIPDANPIQRYWLGVRNVDTSKGLYLNNQFLVGFTSSATEGIDAGYDAIKLKGNPNIALYSILNDTDLSIQTLPTVTKTTKIKVGMDVTNAGFYTFTGYNKAVFSSENIYLIDLKDKIVHNMKSDSQFTFYTNAGFIRDRFILQFTTDTFCTSIASLSNPSDIRMFMAGKTLQINNTLGNPLNGYLFISNVLGQKIFEKQLNQTGSSSEIQLDQASGYYLVSMQSANSIKTVKIFIP